MPTQLDNTGEKVVLDSRYPISLNRIENQEDLGRWVYHLSFKPWITTELIREFVETVYSAKGWDLHPLK